MGIVWIISLVLEFVMLASYAAMAFGFIGLYASKKQGVMLRLTVFSSLMVVFFVIMIYITYFLAIRFGYPLASIVLVANALVFTGTLYLLSVVRS